MVGTGPSADSGCSNHPGVVIIGSGEEQLAFKGRVGMGLWFYPRGGSSQVARYLSSGLTRAGWDVTLVAGSVGGPGDATNAADFFSDVGLHSVDYTPAVKAHQRGDDALAEAVPMHASYEDRGNVPDRFLAAVEPALAEHLTDSWARILPVGFVERSEVFHLHHLTPMHEALARLRPGAPVIAHLHGTELKFLEGVARRSRLAATLGTDLSGMVSQYPRGLAPHRTLDEDQIHLLGATDWTRWRHGAFWAERLRRIAGGCRRFVVTSPSDREAASSLLGVDVDRIEWIPNGVDSDRFRPRPLTPVERLALLRRWLVEDPLGWDETGVPGTVRYRDADLERLVDATGELRPLVLYVGRFTAVKRIPLLLRAYARARSDFLTQPALLVLGGHPGELEGEHPQRVAARLGLDDVFLAGWRGHDELPLGLAAADLVVMPSVNESFGQSAIEAMACGVPVVATRSGGPPSFINTDPARPTGWLVDPDDEAQLAQALVEALNHPGERRRRGERSLALAQGSFSWTSLVPRFEKIYDELRRQVPA